MLSLAAADDAFVVEAMPSWASTVDVLRQNYKFPTTQTSWRLSMGKPNRFVRDTRRKATTCKGPGF